MNKTRKDFIFDMETIGARVSVCPVVDMAYATFEWDRFLTDPYSFEDAVGCVHTLKLSISDQMENYGCKFTKEDVQWWENLPAEARNKLKRSPDDLTVTQFCDTLLTYFKEEANIGYWWSRGNTFDPVILGRLMDSTDNEYAFKQYLKFYKVRDVRTHIDAKFNYTTKNGFVPVADEAYWNSAFIAHDSSHDVAADILRLQAIHRAEHDLDQIER